jgi:hypothetical protein
LQEKAGAVIDLQTCPIEGLPRPVKKNPLYTQIVDKAVECEEKSEAVGVPCEGYLGMKRMRAMIWHTATKRSVPITSQWDPIEQTLWVWVVRRRRLVRRWDAGAAADLRRLRETK